MASTAWSYGGGHPADVSHPMAQLTSPSHGASHGLHGPPPLQQQLPAQPLSSQSASGGIRQQQPIPKSPYVTQTTPSSGPYGQILMPMSNGPPGHWGTQTT